MNMDKESILFISFLLLIYTSNTNSAIWGGFSDSSRFSPDDTLWPDSDLTGGYVDLRTIIEASGATIGDPANSTLTDTYLNTVDIFIVPIVYQGLASGLVASEQLAIEDWIQRGGILIAGSHYYNTNPARTYMEMFNIEPMPPYQATSGTIDCSGNHPFQAGATNLAFTNVVVLDVGGADLDVSCVATIRVGGTTSPWTIVAGLEVGPQHGYVFFMNYAMPTTPPNNNDDNRQFTQNMVDWMNSKADKIHPSSTNPPVPSPTMGPSSSPTLIPTPISTSSPSPVHTLQPTGSPTNDPTDMPTTSPTATPTIDPTTSPTSVPTNIPSSQPTNQPTYVPTNEPTYVPTNQPTNIPSDQPTNQPTYGPTNDPTNQPTYDPTNQPTPEQTSDPTPVHTSEPAEEEDEEQDVEDTVSGLLPPKPTVALLLTVLHAALY